MRRFVGVLLILVFSVWPLAATLPANAESRLPACCRRQGAHHCAMSAGQISELAQESSGAAPVFAPPSRCPSYPGLLAASTVSFHALAGSPASLPSLHARPYAPLANCATARLSQFRTRAGRGPPITQIG
jgi:hypothetical protein